MSYYDELLKKEESKVEVESAPGVRVRVTREVADNVKTAKKRLEHINAVMPELREKYIVRRAIKL